MKKYAFGVDVGGTTVKLGFFVTDGTLLDTWEIPTRTEEQGSHILGDIEQAIRAKLAEKKISMEEVEGVGIGVPGPVAPDGRVLKCVNLGWGVLYIEKILSEALGGIKVKAGNDANVAALGEMWKGGGQGYKNMVMVTLGTGVGGGVILNGKIVTGVNGSGGEIGHIHVCDQEEEPCGCGNKGCLEQYASASGITRITKKYLADHSNSGSRMEGEQELTAKKIFDYAKENDTVALKMVDQVGKMLGSSLAAVCCVINPEAIVIGGGMSRAGDILLSSIQSYFRKYAFHTMKNTEFSLAQLGNQAGIYGGARLVCEEE